MIRVTARLRFTAVCIIYKSFSRNVKFGTGLRGVHAFKLLLIGLFKVVSILVLWTAATFFEPPIHGGRLTPD
jgi:hypothetical protein